MHTAIYCMVGLVIIYAILFVIYSIVKQSKYVNKHLQVVGDIVYYQRVPLDFPLMIENKSFKVYYAFKKGELINITMLSKMDNAKAAWSKDSGMLYCYDKTGSYIPILAFSRLYDFNYKIEFWINALIEVSPNLKNWKPLNTYHSSV